MPLRAKIIWDQNTARLLPLPAVANVTRRHGKSQNLVEVASIESNEATPAKRGGAAKGNPMTIAHEEAVIDPAAVDAIFTQARTANSFTGEVTDEQAQAIYELAKFGPTAFNSQPLRVTYVRSDEARAKLVDALMPGNRAKTASAPLVAILSYDTDWAGQWDNFLPGYNAPKAMYDANPELTAATGNNNAHLQAGYFILAVRSLGFAAGPMTGADFGAIDEAFFPAGDQKSFLVVNIGLPAEGAWGEAKPKFAYEDVVRTV